MANYPKYRCFVLVGLVAMQLGACNIEPEKDKKAKSSVSLEDLGSIKPPLGDLSFAAFKQSVYPLVSKVTCVNCHSKNQSPFFAAENEQDAHDQTIAGKIVDFVHPEQSRMVLQLSKNAHNCWTPEGCNQDAEAMLAAINNWIKLAKAADKTDAKQRLVTEAKTADTSTSPSGPWELTFDLSTLLAGSKASLIVTIEDLDAASYIAVNPRLVTESASIKVKDLVILVNGKEDSQATEFKVVDATAVPPELLLSTTTMLFAKDQGPASDAFKISFGELSLAK